MDLLHARPSIKEYREPSLFQFASSMASGTGIPDREFLLARQQHSTALQRMLE